jgi:hypothetical protein
MSSEHLSPQDCIGVVTDLLENHQLYRSKYVLHWSRMTLKTKSNGNERFSSKLKHFRKTESKLNTASILIKPTQNQHYIPQPQSPSSSHQKLISLFNQSANPHFSQLSPKALRFEPSPKTLMIQDESCVFASCFSS